VSLAASLGAWSPEVGAEPIEPLGAEGREQANDLVAARVQQGAAAGLARDGHRGVHVDLLSADRTAAVLGGVQRLALVERRLLEGRLGAGAPRESGLRLVEGHPFTMLIGLTLPGRKRRQAVGGNGHSVSPAVGSETGVELVRSQARASDGGHRRRMPQGYSFVNLKGTAIRYLIGHVLPSASAPLSPFLLGFPSVAIGPAFH
jgi:hypothetical protein